MESTTMNVHDVDGTVTALAGLSVEEKKVEEDVVDAKQQVLERKELDKMFENVSREKLENLDVVDLPEEFTGLKIYPHQHQGISWLVQNEVATERADVPGWYTRMDDGAELTKVLYKCEVTKQRKTKKPSPVAGSILADGTFLSSTLLDECNIVPTIHHLLPFCILYVFV